MLKKFGFVFILLLSVQAGAVSKPSLNETLSYRLRYMGIFPLGKINITSEPYVLVKQDISKISAHYKPIKIFRWFLGMKGKVNSYVHSKTKLPVRYEEFYSFAGRDDESNVLVYDQENGQIFVDRNGEKETIKVPFNTLDPLSGMYVLRESPWLVGIKKTYNLNSHQSNYIFNMHCVREEAMKFDHKDQKVWVIQGGLKKALEFHEKPKIEFVVWMTQDNRHLPVKIKIKTGAGSIQLKLIES